MRYGGDTELGRAELIETLEQGPVAFVATFNAVVGAELRIVVPDAVIIDSRAEVAANRRRLLLVGAVVLALAGIVFILSNPGPWRADNTRK